jgi:C4-dicarboxylate-specific signal transduction histidine kinase
VKYVLVTAAVTAVLAQVEVSDLAPIIVAMFALVGSWLTYRQARKATAENTAMKNREIDAEAFRRAKDIYEGSIAEQGRQIERIGKQLKAEIEHSTAMEADVRELRSKVNGLIHLLQDAGIEVPTHLRLDG